MSSLPDYLRGHVLVAGAGVSGRSAAALLVRLGVDVTIADDNADAAPVDGARIIPVGQAQEQDWSLVVTSPGWRPDSPLLVDAASRGIDVIGDVELVWRLDQVGTFGDPRTWVVITGTNGKTTTTQMTEAMLIAGGLNARAVGNIGVGVADAVLAKPRIDILVAELSSFQLHWAPTLVPHAGVLLNLAEDHLDWHGSFEAYAAAKERALGGPVAVVAREDAVVNAMATSPCQRVIGFGLAQPAPGDVGMIADKLVFHGRGGLVELAEVSSIRPEGPAGILDAAAAAALATSQGVAPRDISAALEHYDVAGHRGQEVANIGGVRYVDNSKATNPHAADAALAAEESVIWIAGGQLKGASVDELIRTHAHRMRAAVVMGVDKHIIVDALERIAPGVVRFVVEETDPQSAMDEAVRAASSQAQPGDTVLLAPACASLDMYSGMGQRGDMFARAIDTGAES